MSWKMQHAFNLNAILRPILLTAVQPYIPAGSFVSNLNAGSLCRGIAPDCSWISVLSSRRASIVVRRAPHAHRHPMNY